MVENLSPRKRKAVVDLCDSNLKQRKEQEKDRKKRCDTFTGEVNMVQNFYARDDISRMLPGKKDNMSVKQADGKREHRQEGVLLLKIGEAHNLFKEESSVKIFGKSTFAELRPPQVLPSSSFDEGVCICKYPWAIKTWHI